MMLEIFGKKDGLCGGKGGSMHIADLSKGMMGANGIVGGGPPLICGAALTAKTLKTGGVAVAFFGDGASNQGTTFESYNLAKVWNLPAIFVVEDNGYAEIDRRRAGRSPAARSSAREGFGMPRREVDGSDFFAVYEAAREAIERARGGGGPTLLHVKLNRYYGHFEGDAQTYRGAGRGRRSTRPPRTRSMQLPPARDRGRPARRQRARRDRPRAASRSIDQCRGRGQGGAAADRGGPADRRLYVCY